MCNCVKNVLIYYMSISAELLILPQGLEGVQIPRVYLVTNFKFFLYVEINVDSEGECKIGGGRGGGGRGEMC